jgi:hypothetical protein
MSSRFHDDPARVEKQTEMSSFQCKYFLDTPGPGLDLAYCSDPFVRIQRWGGNLQTNTVNLESDFRGLTRKLNRDDVNKNEYTKHKAESQKVEYSTTDPFVNQSRATHPAWTYRSYDASRWEEPIHDPQQFLEKPFHDNISTRILEKNCYETNRSRNKDFKF